MMRALLMALLLAAVSLMSSAFMLPMMPALRTSSALLAKKVAFKNFEDMIEKIETPLLVDFNAQWWSVPRTIQQQFVITILASVEPKLLYKLPQSPRLCTLALAVVLHAQTMIASIDSLHHH
jgi:hypothetical protein